MHRSLGPRWPLSLAPAVAAFASGCSGSPTPPTITLVPTATASLTASPTASAATAPSPCDVAATQRARVAGLLREGKLDRALAVIARADRLCPTTAQASAGERVATLVELGRDDDALALIATIERDAGASEATKAAALAAKAKLTTSGPRPDGDSLYQRGLTQLAAGDRASAQRLLDRAIVALERAVRAEPGQPQSALALDTPNGIPGMLGDVVWARAGDRPTLAVAHDEYVSLFEGSPFRLRVRLRADSALSWIAVSPDGRTLAGGCAEALQLWDVASGKEIGRVGGYYAAAAWSGDGKTLAVINAEEIRVEIWDAATRAVRRVILPSATPPKAQAGSAGAPPTLSPDALCLSQKGDRVAASFSDGSVRIWKSDTGAEVHTFAESRTNVHTVLFSKDDRRLIIADQKGVEVHETVRFRQLRTFGEGYSGHVALTPDQATLAISSIDGLVLWDLATGKVKARFGDLLADVIAIEPDGKRMVISEINGLRVLDLATLNETQRIARHAPGVRSVVWTPDRSALVSGAWDDTIRFWDAKKGAPLRTIHDAGLVNALAVSADGRFLASGASHTATTVYRMPSDEIVHVWKEGSGWITSVAFSPDGAQLLIGSKEAEVKVIDLSTRTLARTLKTGGAVNALGFSPDCTRVVAGTDATTLHQWDTATWNELGSSRTSGGVNALTFDPTGRTLLVADLNAQLFDIVDGDLRNVGSLDGHSTWVESTAIRPDGKVMATGSGDRSVRLWDGATHAALHTLNAHEAMVESVAFRPDGALLASASDDGSIRLWSVRDGRERVAFRAVEGSEDAYAWTPGPNARIELFGPAGRAYPLCRIGERTYRFELCQERFEVPGLTEKVLAGDESYLDP